MRGNLLARLGGAREDVLNKAPGDRSKHTSMGAVLVSTGAVSAVSATFALMTALKLHPVAAVIVGIIWGLVIVNLDRMLVVSMVRDDGWFRNLLIAIPRLALALILGAVLSAPLVLEIFRPEIDPEVRVIIQEDQAQAQAALNSDIRFTGIAAQEDEVALLRARVAGSASADVEADPDVQAATAALTVAQDALLAAQNELNDEVDGDGGTRVPGVGAAARVKQAAVDSRTRERDAAQRDLDRIKREVAQRLADTSQATQEQARAALDGPDGKQAQLDRLLAAKAKAERDVQGPAEGSDGLINRLRALDRLADTPTLGAARLALLVLFASIEILPVLVKLLSLLGKATLYDKLAGRKDTDAIEKEVAAAAARRTDFTLAFEAQKAEAQFQADVRRDTARLRMDTVLSIERGRSELQIEAGRRNNVLLVAKQEELAVKAIDRWAEIASTKTDQELDRWYAAQSAQRVPTAVAAVNAPQASNGSSDGSADGYLDDEPLPDPPVNRPEAAQPAPTEPDRDEEPRPRRQQAYTGGAISYTDFLAQEEAAATTLIPVQRDTLDEEGSDQDRADQGGTGRNSHRASETDGTAELDDQL